MSEVTDQAVPKQMDVVIVGAGFAGMYLLKLMRDRGFNAMALEQGDGVGGTWYWNRYPGARCDVESMQYSHKYLPDLEQEWDWSERYAPQAEILKYANEIADRLDLRRDIYFSRQVTEAHYDELAHEWTVLCQTGETICATFFIMATGCLSVPNKVEFEGEKDFGGSLYQTGNWPHEELDFSGKRVAVIGTGSSAVQIIPQVAKQAWHLVVFQRTPNYVVPARNRVLSTQERDQIKANYADLRRQQAESFSNNAGRPPQGLASETSLDDQWSEYQRRWNEGGLLFNAAFADVMFDRKSNETAAKFVRAKIRETVKDPAIADLLCPTNTLGAKRLCVEIGYFETFNLPHVSLVDISDCGLSITADGVMAGGDMYPVDAIIYATGFDAVTGALLRVEITGRKGRSLRDEWSNGPCSYLGLAINKYPNLFTVTGPASPSVFTNMIPSIEQHCEWIADCLCHLRDNDQVEIEADAKAQSDWMAHNQEVGAAHLRSSSASWYTGENIAGKPVGFMPYIGGFPEYKKKCEEVVAKGYEGFSMA